MVNLIAFEILEIHDLLHYFVKRGVSRATPTAGLPWGQSLQHEHVCVPGSWLHMAIVGPRLALATLEVDNCMLSKKSFQAMGKNMPMLTNPILNNQNNVAHEFVDTSGRTF
jgi:hypothetical protein